MKKIEALNKAQDDSDEEFDVVDGKKLIKQGLSLNWQSLFGTLNNGEHEDALEAYLKCSTSYTQGGRGNSKSIRDCYSEWDRAEFAWLKVEKRLRTILLQALHTGGKEAQEFILAIENMLLCLETGDSTSLTPSPAAEHFFSHPPRLVQPSSPVYSREDNKNEDSEAVMVVNLSSPQLIISLKDSPFHRLLLHATCQFHHMHSKSFHDNKNGGCRATRITPFQSKKCHHTISLVPFALLKTSSQHEADQGAVNGKENTPGNNNSAENRQKTIEMQDDRTLALSLDDVSLEEKVADMDGESSSDDDDDDEYCLVDIIGASGNSNPIENRESYD